VLLSCSLFGIYCKQFSILFWLPQEMRKNWKQALKIELLLFSNSFVYSKSFSCMITIIVIHNVLPVISFFFLISFISLNERTRTRNEFLRHTRKKLHLFCLKIYLFNCLLQICFYFKNLPLPAVHISCLCVGDVYVRTNTIFMYIHT
jgi:hypothetical protein